MEGEWAGPGGRGLAVTAVLLRLGVQCGPAADGGLEVRGFGVMGSRGWLDLRVVGVPEGGRAVYG